MKASMSGAQNQHYVPKFILRQFLVDSEKEQVAVYDKHANKTFQTSIRNIMAERRFNDFNLEEYIVSFESIATGIEASFLPTYRRIIETRQLNGSPQERADLGFLMAFQFLRTKGTRQIYDDLETQIEAHFEKMGFKMSDVEGWEAPTEDRRKMQHLTHIRDSLGKYAGIIAQKDFLLVEPSDGRSFYLGDNPVCLNNKNTFGPYGNIGFAVPGIEMYLPLTSDLLLCAWCPSNLEEIRESLRQLKKLKSDASVAYLLGKITHDQMQTILEDRDGLSAGGRLFEAFSTGKPMTSTEENMDFYNSLQTATANRYVICQNSDFELAIRHNHQYPKHRKGRSLQPT